MNKLMPVVFVGHGSPMNAMQDNEFTKALGQFARKIPKPEAIICVSAHWVTDGCFVTGSSTPEQIYDFFGFPKPLYEIKYRPKGSPSLAKQAAKLLSKYSVSLDTEWGTDHGTWSILKHMYPGCDIPVIQLSLNLALSEQQHYELAKGLFELRKQGVLIIGSGNIVHNLSMIDAGQFAQNTPSWALEFDEYVKNALDSGKDSLLVNYADNSSAAYAVPTNEHYLPLLYVCALRDKGEKVKYFFEGYQHSSLSMRCFSLV
jgi:4,5-DOPA dioxygenase extradiol